jgi:P pilus assembly chaperone PapD
MKTLLTFIGLATSCLLSGCAHDTSSKAASTLEGVAVAGQSVTLTVTNTGNQPFIYQVNGTNVGGATVTVTNR